MAREPSEQIASREAAQGEKMIEIKVRFWTDELAAEKGNIKPKHAWSSGVVRAKSNKPHGISSAPPKVFNSLLELPSVIEKVLIENGVTLRPSPKMRKYLRE
jgi:hypothetical protein